MSLQKTKRLIGLATEQGTQAYAQGHPEIAYPTLGSTRLTVSPAGFGSYRVDVSVESHAVALEDAILSGINLIDTSANYADGGSERLIGKVLGRLIEQGKISREQMVVVSKAGYLQGENYQLSQERKSARNAFPDLVLAGEGLEHCIHPEFLSDQLTRSLQRMNLNAIDCFLLHNPEYFLNWSKSQGTPLQEAREEYYRRIRVAFIHLEKEADAGHIGCYGISSNTFPGMENDYAFTSLTRVWEIANSLSAGHRFRVVEFPMNLLETGAALLKNQAGGQNLLSFALEKNLGVLINRPLNAIVGERLVRLAESHYQGEGVRQARQFRDKVAAVDAEWSVAKNLSQIAFRALRSTAGISSVLVGMRETGYVRDVVTELQRPCLVRTRTDSWKKVQSL